MISKIEIKTCNEEVIPKFIAMVLLYIEIEFSFYKINIQCINENSSEQWKVLVLK